MKNLKDNPDAGFSLIEVVVALLMIFFFTTGALEMFVLSSIFKKKAIQYTTANSLIQQDIEKIKSAADQYSFREVNLSSIGNTFPIAAGSNIPLVVATTGTVVPLALNDKVRFSNSFTDFTVSSVNNNTVKLGSAYTPPTVKVSAATSGATTLTPDSITSVSKRYNLIINDIAYTITDVSTSTVTISPALTSAITSGTSAYILPSSLYLVETANCDSTNTATNTSARIHELFKTNIATAATGTTGTEYSGYKAVIGANGAYTKLKGQNYWLYRKETTDTTDPYSNLKIDYRLVVTTTTTSPDPTTVTPLVKSYTEVIPYASLQCPSQ